MVSYICRLCMPRSEAKAKYASIASYSHWLIVLGDIHYIIQIYMLAKWLNKGFPGNAVVVHIWPGYPENTVVWWVLGCWHIPTLGVGWIPGEATMCLCMHGMEHDSTWWESLKAPPCFWPTSEFWTIESSPRVCFTLFVVGSRHNKSNCQQLQTGPDQLIYPSQPAFAVDTISKRNVVMGRGYRSLQTIVYLLSEWLRLCNQSLPAWGWLVCWYLCFVGVYCLKLLLLLSRQWLFGMLVRWLLSYQWYGWYGMVGMCRSVYAQQRIGVGQWLVSGAGDAGVTTTVRETTRINQATKKQKN